MGRAGRRSSFDQPRRAQRARIKLRTHPDTPCGGLDSVEVEIIRKAGGTLDLHFFALGDTAAISWPDPAEPLRADRLWEHTCFELFVKADGRDAYYEFNFSPSSQWAIYRFAGYRQGMQIAQGLPAPVIGLRTAPRAQVLSVSVDLARATGLPVEEDWPVALSAVIAESGGSKSYWALKHPPGKPDFHHADCFALIVAPPGNA